MHKNPDSQAFKKYFTFFKFFFKKLLVYTKQMRTFVALKLKKMFALFNIFIWFSAIFLSVTFLFLLKNNAENFTLKPKCALLWWMLDVWCLCKTNLVKLASVTVFGIFDNRGERRLFIK